MHEKDNIYHKKYRISNDCQCSAVVATDWCYCCRGTYIYITHTHIYISNIIEYRYKELVTSMIL